MKSPRTLLLLLLIGLLMLVPLLPLNSPGAIVAPALQPPSRTLPLGADPFGRDLALRLLWAAHFAVRNALVILALVMLGVGGLAAVYVLLPAPLRELINQSTLILLSLPPLLVAIALLVALPDAAVVAVALSLLPVVARYTNTVIAQQLAAPYTQAAHLNGASRVRIAAEHILPNVAPRLAEFSIVVFVWAILSITALEFLGLVGSPSDASIGRMIDEGRQVLAQTARPVLAPTFLLLILALLGGTLYNGPSEKS